MCSVWSNNQLCSAGLLLLIAAGSFLTSYWRTIINDSLSLSQQQLHLLVLLQFPFVEAFLIPIIVALLLLRIVTVAIPLIVHPHEIKLQVAHVLGRMIILDLLLLVPPQEIKFPAPQEINLPPPLLALFQFLLVVEVLIHIVAILLPLPSVLVQLFLPYVLVLVVLAMQQYLILSATKK